MKSELLLGYLFLAYWQICDNDVAYALSPHHRTTSRHTTTMILQTEPSGVKPSKLSSPFPRVQSHQSFKTSKRKRKRGDNQNVPRNRSRRVKEQPDSFSTKGQQRQQHSSIPDSIPMLSELMKNTTVEDFGADSKNERKMLPRLFEEERVSRVVEEGVAARNKKQMPYSRPIRAGFVKKNNNGRRGAAPRVVEVVEETGGEKKKKEPWRANFHVSKRTQQRIKGAADDPRGQRRSRVERAIAVLRTLLNAPPHQCNEANVVCALTLSAKLLGPSAHTSDELQSLLFRTTDVLHKLVHEKRLNVRQLCNAAWAVAKHYDRDRRILPRSPELVGISAGKVFGVSETWDLQDGAVENSSQRIDQTVDEIARQLTSILRNEVDEETENESRPRKAAQVGEICMACWAYGILRARRRPPGWQAPPQMGKLPKQHDNKIKSSSSSSSSLDLHNLITFEKWDGALDDIETTNSNKLDTTDILFDSFADAFCKQPHPSSSNDVSPIDDTSSSDDDMPILQCTWSELANIAWAFAVHGSCNSHSSEQLLINLSQEAVRRLDSGQTKTMLSRDISQLVWALGTLSSDNFRLANDLVNLVEAISENLLWEESYRQPLRDWSCPDVVQMIVSLAHARIDDLPLLQILYEEAFYRITQGVAGCGFQNQNNKRMSFHAWEVSVLLWAQARLYLREPQGDVFKDFPHEAVCFIHSEMKKYSGLEQIGIGAQEQANVAWSLTILEEYRSKEAVYLLDAIYTDASRSCQESKVMQLEHAHQLWQALFLLEEESPDAVGRVPVWFREYLQDKWSLEKSREKISSARHKSLSQTLTLMGIAHYNEHEEDIDVAIVLKKKASWTHETAGNHVHNNNHSNNHHSNGDALKVAVEFNGPNHFTRQSSTKKQRSSSSISEEVKVAVEFDGPNHFTRQSRTNDKRQVRSLGHSVLKYRLLKKQGWSVVRVPYYEFDKIPFWASMERQRYLQRLLKTHANIRFSDVDVSEYANMSPNRLSRFD